MYQPPTQEIPMPNRHATAKADQAAHILGRATDIAERGYEVARQALDTTSDRIDDLSKFGKQRPLLAMGISFLAGFFVAKTFF
jgi:hypothetical protein